MIISSPSPTPRRKLTHARDFSRRQVLLCLLLTLLSALTVYAQASGAADKAAAKRKVPAFVERPAGVNQTYQLAFSYYTLREQTAATLTLNNKGPYPVEIKPVLFSLEGARLDVPPVTVGPTSHRVVDLSEWAAAGGPAFLEGSIQFTYEGKDLEVGGQVRLADAGRSLIFEEQVTRLESAYVSSRLEGVWWVPSRNSEIRFILSNTTDSALEVSVDVSGVTPKPKLPLSLSLGPHETRVADLLALVGGAHGKLKETGSISVTHSGAPGALLARGLVRDAGIGFSTFTEFTDPSKYRSARLHGAGLRLGRAVGEDLTPVVVARNLGTRAVTLTGRIPYTLGNGTARAVTLPPLRLSAGEVRSVELHALTRGGGFGTEVASAGLEFEHTGRPGAVIMSALSVGAGGNQVFRVPVFDPSAQRSSTGAYPWRVEGDSSTVVYIKNTTAETQRYVAHLKFEGGSYMLGMKTVEPGQTAAIDIRRLRDEQVPDEDGQVIPRETKSGQVIWSAVLEEEEEPLVLYGRAEQADTVRGMSSSYACQSCCADSYYDSFLVPGGVDAEVDAGVDFDAYQTSMDCYGNLSTFPRSTFSWSSSNSGVATVDSSGIATAVGAGEATITASWTGRINEPGVQCGPCYACLAEAPAEGDGVETNLAPACGACQAFFVPARPQARVTVRPRISGPASVWWFNGETPAGYATTITLTASPAGASSYNWAVVSGADKVTVAPSGNTLRVTGANASTLREVGIQVTVNGVGSRTFNLSVRAPHRLVFINNAHNADATWGYETHVHYRIEDQFSDVLPAAVPINEQWTTGVVADFAGMDWRRGAEGAATVGPADWIDRIQGETAGHTPPPQNPCSPLCNMAVYHWGGQWFVGSSTIGRGRRVQTNTWQKYTDHAEHTNRVSPAP